jgi:hypothetical protein
MMLMFCGRKFYNLSFSSWFMEEEMIGRSFGGLSFW